MHEDDNSLDSALSAAGPARKASLKPDHLRARRPIKPMNLTPSAIVPIGGGTSPPSKQSSPTKAADVASASHAAETEHRAATASQEPSLAAAPGTSASAPPLASPAPRPIDVVRRARP